MFVMFAVMFTTQQWVIQITVFNQVLHSINFQQIGHVLFVESELTVSQKNDKNVLWTRMLFLR